MINSDAPNRLALATGPDPLPPYITKLNRPSARIKYQCSVCPHGRTMRTFEKHVESRAHVQAVRHFIDEAQANEAYIQQHAAPTIDLQTPTFEVWNPSEEPQETTERPLTPTSPLSLLCLLDSNDPLALDDNHSFSSDDSDDDARFIRFQKAFEALGEGFEDDWGDEDIDEDAIAADLAGAKAQDSLDWYPFKKKEHVLALLMIGNTRSILSRAQYQRIRAILRIIFHVKLPEWGVLRAVSTRMKERVGMSLSERKSPWGTPLFGLNIQTIISNELANPMVSPHLVFVPELSEGPINRLAQCRKWREEYSPELRVQMIVSNQKHFYIYEPVQLWTKQLVVPIFFYQQNNSLKAKCLPALIEPDANSPAKYKIIIQNEPPFDSDELLTLDCNSFWKTFGEVEGEPGLLLKTVCKNFMYQPNGSELSSHPVENKWRAQAAGKVIRHIPISLYSDDTSGNVSKKWNKHMSLYFTLSGLPPSMSNQEYNIHFLGTSNVGNALELLDQVVDDVNKLGQEGFITYDDALGEDVLAMVVVLFHLGDSPMHAEAAKMADKEASQFVHDFLCINHEGMKVLPPRRDWAHTIALSHELWITGQKHHTKTLYEDLIRQFGLRDIINDHFVKQIQVAHSKLSPDEVDSLLEQLDNNYGHRIFNPMLRLKGFDGHKDTPVEILHVVLLGITKYLFRDAMKDVGNTKPGSMNYNYLSAKWRSFSSKGLNIPAIQPGNLITYYNSLVGKDFRTVLQTVPFVLFDFLMPDKRHVWTSLCILSSYIFQTEIPDMNQYLAELDTHISWFLKQLIALTAQWVNKPKFHMLVHLRESIHRFGPACLFATEKFESFNGVLRNASIHSNHLSPGRDIANSFNTAQMLRMLISGSSFFDKELQQRVVAGPLLRALFEEVPELVAAMGLKPACESRKSYVIGAKADIQSAPPVDFNQLDNRSYLEHKFIILPGGHRVEPHDFLMLKANNQIARVLSIWNADVDFAERTMLVLQICDQGRMIPFYGMREVLVTERIICQSVKAVECILNIQHNCHEGRCTISQSYLRQIERKESSISLFAMKHQDTNSFIINSAAQYSSDIHRKVSNFQYSEVTAADWERVISEGLRIWHDTPLRTSKKKKTNGHQELV
ncbi:hypothetical protein DFH28DRAFT_1129815 [Melampsora americana]|nr:hypothetical protein DFH28DRAFT_1129815 [Melampsora americana]